MVALFNAIAKAKRDTVAAEEEAAAKKKAVVGAATVSLGSAKDDGSVISRVSAKSSGKASTKAGEAGDTAEGKPRQWAALRDDYMVGEKLTVKVGIPIQRMIADYNMADLSFPPDSLCCSTGTRR